MNGTRVLTVQTAEIKTATVEIRTLTVSGKQVTQAVFRQLREEMLIDYDGEFAGQPWGTVNYHPDKCGDKEHLHVVWQRAAELRRCRVLRTPWDHLWTEEADVLAAAAYCANGHRAPEWIYPFRDECQFVWDGLACAANRPLLDVADHTCTGEDFDELLGFMSAAVAAEAVRRQRHQARWAELQALPQLFIAV